VFPVRYELNVFRSCAICCVGELALSTEVCPDNFHSTKCSTFINPHRR
jgi:hypothetical protein